VIGRLPAELEAGEKNRNIIAAIDGAVPIALST